MSIATKQRFDVNTNLLLGSVMRSAEASIDVKYDSDEKSDESKVEEVPES